MQALRKSVSAPVFFASAVLSIACAIPAFGQVDRSGLSGTVTDPAGRLLPGTQVTATMPATGLARKTITSSDGSYSIPDMPVGNYVVAFEHPGFASTAYENVVQTINRTRTLDAKLRLSGVAERVSVSANAEIIDRNTSSVTGLIERKQADELPLNGRNWASLTAYIPGAIDTGGSNQRSVRFAGRGLDDSSFTYDGVDATNIVNQTQRPWSRLSIPLDAIAEFRVDTQLSAAGEGMTAGAQLAVISPSGTNAFHGRLFEFVRNNILDASVPLWANPAGGTQPLRLNQFGGSLGGPIVHDKTFFFIASEAYRQNWGYPVSAVVPSATFVASIPSSSPVYAIVHAYPGPGPNTVITPYTANTDPGDPNFANYDLLTCACTQVVNENSYMLRLDQHFTSRTTAFMRFNYDRSVDTQPASVSSTYLAQKVTTPVNGVLDLQHVFSPNSVNDAKFGFNRSTNDAYNFSPTAAVYQIKVSGAPGPGLVTQNYTYNSVYVGNSYSGVDDLTLVHGRQTLKFGVEYRRIQVNQNYGQHGTVSFSSLTNLAADKVKSASLTGALPVNDLRKNWYFGYAQDEFRVRPNFTLNLGVRYNVFGLFTEAHGKANPFDFSTCGPVGFCGVGASFGLQNYGDFDPRLGLSWSPPADLKTTIRAGFGIYHEDGQLDDQNLPAKNEVPSYALTNTSYPVSFSGSGVLSPNAEQRDRADSYTEQWNLSFERELSANFVGTLTYLGSHGVHLLQPNVVNLINPSTGVAQYPAFAPAVAWRGSVGASSYNGLITSVRRQFRNGFLLALNYAYTHELDNGSNGSGDGDNIAPQNPLCTPCEWASGAWDARHVLNGNVVYAVPLGYGKRMLNHGFVGAVAGGWQLSTTVVARTGFPVNVLLPSTDISEYGNSGELRPNRVQGVSLTPPGGRNVYHWINPAAYAIPASLPNGSVQFGNAGRDDARGPGTFQIDMSADKTFPIHERASLEFRSEFYNIFNHPQPGQPQATVGVNGFGTIINTINLNTAIVNPITPVGSGTPREMQFALRLNF